MTVDRLSALDQCFLRLESDAAPMHVGWIMIGEGDPPNLEELRAHVENRLELLPRFRRRVRTSRLHDPVWVEDRDFDVAAHVRRARPSARGGIAGLRDLAGNLLSVPLDRRRPLWRLHLIDGLGNGRFAVVGQAHHALVDGVGAVEMASLLLDRDPSRPPATPAHVSPDPSPGIVQRALASLTERAALARAAGSFGLRALADPMSVGEAVGELRRLGAAVATVGAPASSTLLGQPIGPERSVAFARLPLAAAIELGRRRDATVNDVVLATAALALGRYLRRLGESHPWLRALVPVGTCTPAETEGPGNRLAVMFVELPVAQRDPAAALAEVCRQTTARKRAGQPDALAGLVRAARLAPVRVRDVAAWMLTRPETFNTVVSNIAGSREPLYLLGRRVQAAYPAVPLIQGHGLAVGVLSYADALHVGLCAYPGTVPRVIELARDFTSAFDALRTALLPQPPRTSTRAKTRQGRLHRVPG